MHLVACGLALLEARTGGGAGAACRPPGGSAERDPHLRNTVKRAARHIQGTPGRTGVLSRASRCALGPQGKPRSGLGLWGAEAGRRQVKPAGPRQPRALCARGHFHAGAGVHVRQLVGRSAERAGAAPGVPIERAVLHGGECKSGQVRPARVPKAGCCSCATQQVRAPQYGTAQLHVHACQHGAATCTSCSVPSPPWASTMRRTPRRVHRASAAARSRRPIRSWRCQDAAFCRVPCAACPA